MLEGYTRVETHAVGSPSGAFRRRTTMKIVVRFSSPQFFHPTDCLAATITRRFQPQPDDYNHNPRLRPQPDDCNLTTNPTTTRQATAATTTHLATPARSQRLTSNCMHPSPPQGCGQVFVDLTICPSPLLRYVGSTTPLRSSDDNDNEDPDPKG